MGPGTQPSATAFHPGLPMLVGPITDRHLPEGCHISDGFRKGPGIS